MAASVKENKPGRGFYIERRTESERGHAGAGVFADGSESHGCSSHEEKRNLVIKSIK